MAFKLIEYKKEGRISYITLNRPEKRNALNDLMVQELKDAFHQADEDDDGKVIVLKANGDVFSAGADLDYLKQLQSNTFEENLQDSTHLMELFHQIYTLDKIVIAQVEGHAIAGGCGLATVCDFTFAVPEAKFGYTEVKIGFIPAIVMVFLLRKIGEAKAKELLLTGELIEAEEAKNFGLVNDIWFASDIHDQVRIFAEKLCKNASATSLAFTKKMIARVQEYALADALQYAAKMNAEARGTDDCKKGIQAFLDKEKINW